MGIEKMGRIYFLFILIIPFNLIAQDHAYENVKIEFHDSIYYDIFIYNEEIKKNITNYDPWEYIREIQISDSGKYLFVWHKLQSGEQLIISTYDMYTLEKINDISPGFGGELIWTGDDKLMHIYGCGTNCYSFNIYTLGLEELEIPDLKISDYLGGYEISPQKRYVVFYSMFEYEYCILDLKKMDIVTYQIKKDSGRIFRIEYENDMKLIIHSLKDKVEIKEIIEY